MKGNKMKLKEAIHDLPETDWIDFIEQSTVNYRSPIGKAPKSMIKGPVLNYEVIQMSPPIEVRGIVIHKAIVKWKGKKLLA